MIRLTHSQLLPIGLDIGRDSIKMLQLEVAGTGLSVRAACLRKFPEGAAADLDVRMAMMGDMIRQMLREGPFSGRRVVTALPREIVQIKNYRLPPMPPQEMESAVQLEAANLFSFDAEQGCIRCLPAGEVRQGNEVLQEVIVFAAQHERIETFIEQLHRCGVAVESLDVEPCALYRSVERFIRRREDEQEVQVLLDVGFTGSRVVIGRGRDISFIKTIDIGGQHFQQAVSSRLGISEAEAGALRRRLAESGSAFRVPGPASIVPEPGTRNPEPDSALSAQHSVLSDPVRRAVFDAARGVMEQLGHELALCLRYQAVTFRGCRPSRLRLLGGEAADSDLQAVLGPMLTIPMEVVRPLYSVDTSRLKAAERRGAMAEWAVALGLALRRTEQRFGPRDGKPRQSSAECKVLSAEADNLALSTQNSALPKEAVHA